MIPWLRAGDPPDAFPPVDTALTDPDGLLCAGGEESAPRPEDRVRAGWLDRLRGRFRRPESPGKMAAEA